ncbi:class I SAM-dependent methyltransferase [Leisingera sp. ANG59]|uniref:class I SAM-dependent methyltransferase n=1 Tax=Leisingera sp. ANG59 TaxID=2675221 RepID=UPI0015716345|nr:class I SAM-dependent methyltransferase [Leisingera sp. ANG59]NSY39327.1 methyltransferase domain-containing protein [Leisingera sp. ANG59]
MYRMFVRPAGPEGETGADMMERNGPPMARWIARTSQLSPQGRVLEIGFGPGLGLEQLVKIVPDGHVTGLDPSKLMHQRAGRRNAEAVRDGRLTLVEGVAEAMPFDDNIFDLVVSVDNHHFWTDPQAGLRAALRVLRPGGRLICAFTLPSGGSTRGLSRRLQTAGFANPRALDCPEGEAAEAWKPEQ